MNFRWSVNARLLLLLVIYGLFASPARAHLPIPPKKGEIGKKAVQTVVPDFTLMDQDGKPFQFAKARGKLILLTFVFTTCPDLCPLLTAKFAAIQRSLEDEKRDDYLLLSITTDPERDGPGALKSYGESYKADFRHWLFLTGSRGQLKKVWDAFGVAVRKSNVGEIQHTTLTTLIDHQGTRRFDYYTDKWQEKEILKDIASLPPPKSK
jgi:protein SCO1/2